MTVRALRIARLLLALCLVAVVGLRATAQDRPNIVFLMADDLGFGELGCYGQTKIKTPNIDRMAKEGLKFTTCYSGSSVCAPSRSVLMTGIHTGRTPIRMNGGGMALAESDVTVAEVLKAAGYATGGFGKWGLGTEGTTGQPSRQGFDRFFGFYHQVHAHFHYPVFLWDNDKQFPLPENEGKQAGRYAPDVIHEQGLKFIRENKDRPFFCYLPYTLTHVELAVPEDSKAPFRGKWKEYSLPDPRKGYRGSDEPHAEFAGMVSRLDRQVGEVLALLKSLDLDEKTVVFFTSDNGALSGAWKDVTDFFEGTRDLRGYKGQFYEGGIRVPLVVRWPGRIAPNATTDQVAMFHDVLPTLAELGGGTTPPQITGVSLVPTLLNTGTQKQSEFLYWEHPAGKDHYQAVRKGSWKIVQPGAKKPFELYDLAKDPSEKLNLATERPEVLRELLAIAGASHTPPREFPQEERAPTVDDYVR